MELDFVVARNLCVTFAAVVMVWVLWLIIKGHKGTLFSACESGDIEGVKRHLADGADVNAKDNSGDTPLHIASFERHTEIAELLIAKGADVNAEGRRNDYTPLHTAADMGAKEIAELLIAKGAEVNARSEYQLTPLHEAVSRGYNYEKTVELLIANGADVNAKEDGGWTPLHYAAEFGRKEVAELLIANGADVNAKGDEKKTPLDMLSSEELVGEKAETAIFLRKHGGKTGEELKAEGK